MADKYYALTSIRKPSGVLRKRSGKIPELLDLETLKFYEDVELYEYFYARNPLVTDLEEVPKKKALEIIENFKKKGTPFRAPEEDIPEPEDSDISGGEVKEINFYDA